jgi:hypothetical protein
MRSTLDGLKVWAVRAATAVFLASVAAAGVFAFVTEIVTDFRWAPSTAFPPGMSRSCEKIRAAAPEGAPIFYVHADSDKWLSGLWQRALYPQHVYVVVSADGSLDPAAREVRSRFAVGYALAAGNPPPDPGFEWKLSLPALPGYPPVYEFGKLRAR